MTGEKKWGAPFLATMFQAVGLKVIAARERSSEGLEMSTSE